MKRCENDYSNIFQKGSLKCASREGCLIKIENIILKKFPKKFQNDLEKFKGRKTLSEDKCLRGGVWHR